MRIVFDIETDGLLDTVTKINCIGIKVDDEETVVYHGDEIEKGIKLLIEADELIGHYICGYDLLVIKKLYNINLFDKKLFDTKVVASIFYPNLSHHLKDWGERLGLAKINVEDLFEVGDKLFEYCKRDVDVTELLYQHLKVKVHEELLDAINLEQTICRIFTEQQYYGVKFDIEKCLQFYAELKEKEIEIKSKLLEVLPPPIPRYHKKTGKLLGYTEFNVGSRTQWVRYLKDKYNWRPVKLTDKGGERFSDDIIESLPYDETKLLYQYMVLQKRISQLYTGDKSLYNLYNIKTGRIHGRVHQIGAVTFRTSHSDPNISQVPSKKKEYGKEFRELFVADRNKVLVGIDASQLELRCLAGYLYQYDNGIYTNIIHTGTDMHQFNADLLNVEREQAKTLIYAFIYGAGFKKLGVILIGLSDDSSLVNAGKDIHSRFATNLPALIAFSDQVKERIKSGHVLRSLDGRVIDCGDKEYVGVNYLCQSAGAIMMKRALVILEEDLQRIGYIKEHDYAFVINSHDEWQIECNPEHAETIGKLGCESITKAGEYYNFPCKLEGEYKIGNNWYETH